MLKGVLLVCVSTVAVCMAVLWYQPLPDGIEDPFRAHIFMKIISIIKTVSHIRNFLGYGSLYRNIWQLQKLEQNREPVTAAYGDLKVTRNTVSGIPVIIYQPWDASKLHPAIIFFHGGGWTIGGPDIYDKTVYDYANQTHTVIFNVGYRLAPEHPFPEPLQDCFDVVSYVLRYGAQYNVDVTKVGVAGDSAGGNLAAAVILKLFKEKSDLPPLLFQVLHYPVLQALNMRLPSYVELNQTMPILTSDLMSTFFAYYLGLDIDNMDYYTEVISKNEHIPHHIRNSKYVDVKLLPEKYQKPQDDSSTETSTYDPEIYERIKDVITNPLFAPLLAPDLTGLPPTLIHICEFDVLRDDGFLYARRLADAGVKVKVHFGKGGFHADIVKGLPNFLLSSNGKKALSAAYNFINEILEH